jgi:hypothetical protein
LGVGNGWYGRSIAGNASKGKDDDDDKDDKDKDDKKLDIAQTTPFLCIAGNRVKNRWTGVLTQEGNRGDRSRSRNSLPSQLRHSAGFSPGFPIPSLFTVLGDSTPCLAFNSLRKHKI